MQHTVTLILPFLSLLHQIHKIPQGISQWTTGLSELPCVGLYLRFHVAHRPSSWVQGTGKHYNILFQCTTDKHCTLSALYSRGKEHHICITNDIHSSVSKSSSLPTCRVQNVGLWPVTKNYRCFFSGKYTDKSTKYNYTLDRCCYKHENALVFINFKRESEPTHSYIQ